MDYDISVLISKIVERDIADALNVAPEYPHQTTFAIPYYQNQLVVRVVNETLNHYFICQQGDAKDLVAALIYFLREPSVIETIVQESFVSILEEDVDWTKHVYIPDRVPPLRELYNLVRRRSAR